MKTVYVVFKDQTAETVKDADEGSIIGDIFCFKSGRSTIYFPAVNVKSVCVNAPVPELEKAQ